MEPAVNNWTWKLYHTYMQYFYNKQQKYVTNSVFQDTLRTVIQDIDVM